MTPSQAARMDDGVCQAFVRTAMAAPYLARDDERVLARAWREQSDVTAMHRLAEAHMRLVIAIAGRFRRYGLPAADLIQEGHIGLLEAAARFEPDRDVRFSTYATWWIRAAIQDHVLRNWSIVRGGTSSGQKALFFKLRRLRRKLTEVSGPTPSMDSVYARIAEVVGVAKEDVAAMDARLSGADTSLNAPISRDDEDGGERMDLLVCDRALPDETVGESIDAERRTGWLKAALQVLTDREARVLKARRLQEEASTLEALGRALGVSKERVRQIEHRALEKLRRVLLERYPEARAAVTGAIVAAVCAWDDLTGSNGYSVASL